MSKTENKIDESVIETPPVEEKVTPQQKKSKEENVTISKSDLDKLFSTITKQNEKIELLFQVADKGRLAKAQGSTGSLIHTAKVSRWPDNKKYILGWKLTKNVSEIVNGRWLEDQKTMLVFDDGNTEEVSLLDFYRKIVKEKAEIISRSSSTDISGKEVQILHLRFSDGKEIDIDSIYIN